MPSVHPPISVLDVSEYYGATSGGIRTYLDAKGRWAATHPELRATLLIPGERAEVTVVAGRRQVVVRGPRIPLNDPYRLLLDAGAVRAAISQERPDIIELGSHLAAPSTLRRALRGDPTPVVWYYHGHLARAVLPRGPGSSFERWIDHAVRAHVRRVASHCRRVLVATPALAAELGEMGIPHTAVVPLGVDLEQFHPRRRLSRAATRTAWQLPEGPLALFAGRFAREKSLPLLLDAWPAVQAKTGARLILLGDGPQAARLRRHPYAGQVLWRPFDRDKERLADLLAAVDLFISPGYETFGLAALEATACATPILSYDQGGVAERLRAGGGGSMTAWQDPREVAELAVALLAGDGAAIGAEGRAHAERHHAWDSTFERMVEVYRQVLSEVR